METEVEDVEHERNKKESLWDNETECLEKMEDAVVVGKTGCN